MSPSFHRSDVTRIEFLIFHHFHSQNAGGGKLKIQYELHQNDEKMGSYQYEINYKEISE
jgi:uncharacterized beta-barrel protein YwiB (DUF1934 family)